MTLKTKFKAMSAGREMDALVAEKVMDLSLGPCTSLHEGHVLECAYGCAKPHRRVLAYSTDIAAAWEVWLHLRSNPRRFSLFIEALFTLSDDHEGEANIDGLIGKLDPDFICRAALLSLEL